MTNKTFLYLGAAFIATLQVQATYVLSGEHIRTVTADQQTIRPLTAPYLHEDSFVQSDLRAWYLNHQLESIGGEVTVAALQVRVAINQKMQLVAYKDGYTRFSGGALDGNDGWNDIGLGLKYAFLQDWENSMHAALGVGYEFNWGDESAFQNTDELRLWASFNKSYENLHLGLTTNYITAIDLGQGAAGNSDMLTFHFHSDYYVADWISPVFEINGYVVTNDAGTGASNLSGIDAVSLGSGQNEDVWTAALGAEIRPPNVEVALRAAFERPFLSSDNIFDSRWTFSAVYDF